MGCCGSRAAGEEAPNEAIRTSSSRNITAPSTRPGSRGSHTSHDHGHPSRRRQDAIDRPNTPLKPIPESQRSRLPNVLASPTATSRSRVKPLSDSTNLSWTRSRLDKERNDFWDTQVTGSPEVWGAVRLAAKCLQNGSLQEAQSWLEATECTCPTGCLWKGVYDSTGVMYKVPEWLVVEPDGLVEESESEEEAATASASNSKVHESADEGENDVVIVRARISRTQRDVKVRMRKCETVAVVIEKVKKQAKLDPESSVRLAYGGRLYALYETLESHPYWNFANDYILTALVVE